MFSFSKESMAPKSIRTGVGHRYPTPNILFYFTWLVVLLIVLLLTIGYWIIFVQPAKNRVEMVREKPLHSVVDNNMNISTHHEFHEQPPRNNMPPVYPTSPPEYPTRGAKKEYYQQLGVLVSQDAGEDKPVILGLFGRKISSRDRWEYYVASDQYHMYKLPAQFKNRMCDDDVGCDEIYNGDEVIVPDYANQTFKARIYKYAMPKMA